MTYEEWCQYVWENLNSKDVLILFIDWKRDEMGPPLFDWLRTVKPVYESATEMLLPNGSWLILLADSPEARQACALAAKDERRHVVIA